MGARTYKDRAVYLIKAVRRRRLRLRELAIEYKGKQCAICQYHRCPQALEFRHTDPRQKDFGISAKGYTRSWDKVRNELDRCVLVCANCHREIHSGITQPPRETLG